MGAELKIYVDKYESEANNKLITVECEAII